MRRAVVVLLLVVCVAAAVGCREHGRERGAGRRSEDNVSDDGQEWNEEYDNSDFSQQDDETSDEEAAESAPQMSTTFLRSEPQINSRHYGTSSHHHGGYGAKSYSSVSLSPVAVAIECTVMDPLEHIVWLQARCPDEYDRGNVIAKGAVSNIANLFSVSVSGEDGTFVSTLNITDPTAQGAGGVFRCEAWPHPGYGRHKRELTPRLVGEVPEEPSSREGRALQDPWNAIILGGGELIEECFYGSYDDKWRKLRRDLDDNPTTSKHFQMSARKLDNPFVPMQPKESHLLKSQQESTTNTGYTFETVKFVPTSPPTTNSAYMPLPPVTPATPSMQQPNQPNVKLYQTYNKHESTSTEDNDGIMLSDLSNPEIRLQFLRSLSPEQLKIWHETFPSGHDADKIVVPPSSMLPLQRIFHTEGRSTPSVKIPQPDGLELKTNMPTLERYAKSRMIHFLPENGTQTS